MRSKPARVRSPSGFTLLELIMVLVLLGILSIYVGPQMFNVAIFNARGLHNETLSFLRYAQKTAIAQRRVVCLAFTPATATLRIGTAPGTIVCDAPLRGPAGGLPGVLTAKAGAVYRTVPNNFNFNGLGQPVSVSGDALATQTLQVDGQSRTITVEAATGYVHD